jgi:putative transposase
MPQYRRNDEPGGTYFFTVVTLKRRPILAISPAIDILRQAFIRVQQRHIFTIDAIVVLPDHIHTIWTLPMNDIDFSNRWRMIKSIFSHEYLRAGGQECEPSARRFNKKQRGVWQHRYWEHTVRSDEEFEALCNYIHYNPVKHGYADCPHNWSYSSFPRFVQNGCYDNDWGCKCSKPFKSVIGMEMETKITGE